MHSGGQDVFSSGLHIGAAPSPPVEIVLKSNGAEIDCTVLDGQQKTPPEAQVVLLPDSPHRSHLALREECQTDASGKCVLLGVAPGSYHAFAFAKEDRPDFHDPDAVAGLGTGGEAVTVAQGDKKLVQLEIIQSEQQR
jgi:hypothetical protein